VHPTKPAVITYHSTAPRPPARPMVGDQPHTEFLPNPTGRSQYCTYELIKNLQHLLKPQKSSEMTNSKTFRPQLRAERRGTLGIEPVHPSCGDVPIPIQLLIPWATEAFWYSCEGPGNYEPLFLVAVAKYHLEFPPLTTSSRHRSGLSLFIPRY
jgi:hypothetical protein